MFVMFVQLPSKKPRLVTKSSPAYSRTISPAAGALAWQGSGFLQSPLRYCFMKNPRNCLTIPCGWPVGLAALGMVSMIGIRSRRRSVWPGLQPGAVRGEPLRYCVKVSDSPAFFPTTFTSGLGAGHFSPLVYQSNLVSVPSAIPLGLFALFDLLKVMRSPKCMQRGLVPAVASLVSFAPTPVTQEVSRTVYCILVSVRLL